MSLPKGCPNIGINRDAIALLSLIHTVAILFVVVGLLGLMVYAFVGRQMYSHYMNHMSVLVMRGSVSLLIGGVGVLVILTFFIGNPCLLPKF